MAALATAAFAALFAVHGTPSLKVSIRCDCAGLKAGDEIPIVFTITNAGSAPFSYSGRTYDRSGRIPEFALEAEFDGMTLPDPRSLVTRGFIGGGLAAISELKPGESFSQIVPLNLWAHVIKPGEYVVRGRYSPDPGLQVTAEPIRIRVLPRSDAEMAGHVASLAAEFRASLPEPPARVIQRLMYTMDPRAADVLRPIQSQDNNTRFWIEYAFAYYLRR